MHDTPPPHPTDPLGGLWRTWSTTRFVIFAFLLLAASFLLQILVYGLTNDIFLPVLVADLVGVILPCWHAAREAGGTLGRDFHLTRPEPLTLVAAVIVAVAALVPTSFLAELSSRIHAVDPQWVLFYQKNLPGHWPGIALAAVTVVVVAPLAEELLFRGVVYRLARRTWGPWPAALVSALAFGLIHGEPWFLFGLIGLGLLFAFLYETTGSLLATVIAHGVHNGISLALMVAQRDELGDSLDPHAQDWLFLVLSAVALAVTLIVLRRRGHGLGETR